MQYIHSGIGVRVERRGFLVVDWGDSRNEAVGCRLPCQTATMTCLLDNENSPQQQVCGNTLVPSRSHSFTTAAVPKRKEPATNGSAPPKEKKPRTSAANKEPKQAKVFDLPGQTRDTPEEACRTAVCNMIFLPFFTERSTA